MSVRPSMEGPDGKLRWAKKHLQRFRDEVSVFESSDSHTIVVEDDPDASQYVFKIRGLKPPDPDWGFLIGDCIHNMRSALDHLVYQLALIGKWPEELTDREAKACSFPIHDDPSRFPNPSTSGRGPIDLLRVGEQTRITELQPFNALNPSIWGVRGVRFDDQRLVSIWTPAALMQLRDWDNIDKHRTVHATWRTIAILEARQPPPPFTSSHTFGGALEDGTEIERWDYPIPKPELPADVDVNSQFPILVALGEFPILYGAADHLDCLSGTVRAILDVFRPCVEVGAAPLPLSTLIH